MKNERLLNIELLRIFSMLLIFLWHIGGHYMPYVPAEANVSSVFVNYSGLFITFHVDVFILITGYFGIRKRAKAFIKTLVLCVFYALVLNIIVCLNCGHFNFSEVFMPLSSSPWWFMRVYMILILIAPVLETYIENTSKKEFMILFLVALLLDVYFGFFLHLSPYDNNGYDIFNFIFVYLLGCLMRRNEKLIKLLKEQPLLPALIFFMCCIIRYKVQPITSVSWTDYNSPLNIIMAISMFCIFLKIKVSQKLTKPIIFFSSSAIGVYLITDYKGIRDFIAIPFARGMAATSDSIFIQTFFILLFIIAGFVLCCIIDKVRIRITKPINKLIDNKLSSKYNV